MREFRNPFKAVSQIFASGKGTVSSAPVRGSPATTSTKEGDSPQAKKIRKAIGTGSRRTLLTAGLDIIGDSQVKRRSLLGGA